MIQTLDSKIIHVTVFKDRAEVTRSASVTLEAGQHTLVFDHLTEYIDQDSIQVKGEGNVVLSNINFKEFTEDLDQKVVDERQAKKDAAEEKKNIIQEDIERLRKEKELVLNLMHRFTNTSGTQEVLEIAPQKWDEMFEFYQQKVKALDQKIREATKSWNKANQEDIQASTEYHDYVQQQYFPRKQVEVVVNVAQAQTLSLTLSYLAHQVSWQPMYDIRLNTQKRMMNIAYRAMIKQHTKEDWEKVKIKISTAQPGQKGKHPNLKPWRINSADQVNKKGKTQERQELQQRISNMQQELRQAEQEQANYHEMKKEYLMRQDMAMRQNMEELITTQEQLEQEAQEMVSKVETGATSVVFEINEPQTIASDNEAHKINITTNDFPVGWRYSTVPKLSSLAYLKAKTKNTTDYPFLAGKAHVFLDNNFVTNLQMQDVAPKEEFWTFFGVDKSIQVFHKFLRKYEKTSGSVFGKKIHTLIYEYEIEVKNHKSTEEEIIVWDQLPISGDESIKVHLLQPNPKEKEAPIKYHKTDFAYIQWHKQLKPGEKIMIPFSFAIEYPEGTEVMGL